MQEKKDRDLLSVVATYFQYRAVEGEVKALKSMPEWPMATLSGAIPGQPKTNGTDCGVYVLM